MRSVPITIRSSFVALVVLVAAGCGGGNKAATGTAEAEPLATTSRVPTSVVVVTSVVSSTAPPASTVPATTAPPAASTNPPSTPPPVPLVDWNNFSYAVECLGNGHPGITLVDGKQEGTENNGWLSASLVSATDGGGGNTLVLIACDANLHNNGIEAVLLGPAGNILSQMPLPQAEWTDGAAYVTPEFEGWEASPAAYDAASVRFHKVVVEGTNLVIQDGATKPKCAAMGVQDMGQGRVRMNDEGALVAQFQQKIIDEGYGAEVIATGGADGDYGPGTISAATDYLSNEFDLSPGKQPADWFGEGEGGPVYIYWLDVGWTKVLGLDCYGEYR